MQPFGELRSRLPSVPPPTAKAQVWTTRALQDWIGAALSVKGVESAKLCAEMLVAHVLGCDRLKLYTDPDRPATPLERQTLRELVSRALEHEPVQYLVGEAWFMSLPMKVDRRVLIPRPCTEQIVETVIQHHRAGAKGGNGFENPVIADVCTGSGCIGVALAKNIKSARVAATDISAEALEVARENAARHSVTPRIEFLQGDLLTPLLQNPIGAAVHYLVSNPPYIPDAEWDQPGLVGRNVKGHEPDIALRGGADGLKFVGPIIAEGPRRLAPDGLLVVEIASSTSEQVLELARSNPLLIDARIIKDLDAQPRTLVARRV